MIGAGQELDFFKEKPYYKASSYKRALAGRKENSQHLVFSVLAKSPYTVPGSPPALIASTLKVRCFFIQLRSLNDTELYKVVLVVRMYPAVASCIGES